MAKNIKRIRSLLLAAAACAAAVAVFLNSGLELKAIAAASAVYHEIQIKLVWDRLYNLDLYVEEPSGETASKFNVKTAGGGELGYIDESGEWHYGDSGDNEAPEIYRARYGMEGEYSIRVFCNRFSPEEEGEFYDVSANAYVVSILYGHSKDEVFLNFPESGAKKIASDENDGWWDAGGFDFTPIAKKPAGWEMEDPRECFIATAAYGGTEAAEVETLRSFRQTCLERSSPGRKIIGFYYKAGPAAAAPARRSALIRFLLRTHLAPAVNIIKLFGA